MSSGKGDRRPRDERGPGHSSGFSAGSPPQIAGAFPTPTTSVPGATRRTVPRRVSGTETTLLPELAGAEISTLSGGWTRKIPRPLPIVSTRAPFQVVERPPPPRTEPSAGTGLSIPEEMGRGPRWSQNRIEPSVSLFPSTPRASEPPIRRPRRENATPSDDLSTAGLLDVGLQVPWTHHWLQDLSTRWGANLHTLLCRPVSSPVNSTLRLIEVCGTQGSMPAISGFLKEESGSHNLSVAWTGPLRLLVWLLEPTPVPCAASFATESVCLDCPFLQGSPASARGSAMVEWRLLFRESSQISSLIKELEAHGVRPVSMTHVKRFRAPNCLTERQELALGIAHQLGYYDQPRRAHLKDIARLLGVSPPTAMEILRRGMAKILALHEEGPSARENMRTRSSLPGWNA